jgi:hypothetical protein
MNPKQYSNSGSTAPDALADGTAPAFYEWTAPVGGLVVRLSFDFIDELSFEVMKGFGAIPRRGAEVGGILIGTVDEGGQSVTINGFYAVPCKHARGPSYILEDEELAAVEAALIALEPGPGADQWAVGFYRSNTRDALELVVEDQDLLERFFPAEPGICLMIRPFATRVSEATIFLRRDGAWTSGGIESVFPFRRKELAGGKRPRRERLGEETVVPVQEPLPSSFALDTPFLPAPAPVPAPRTVKPLSTSALAAMEEAISLPIPSVLEFDDVAPSRVRGTWVWVPLSLIFLLLGIVLGFQIALGVSRSQRAVERQADPYALDLKVVEFGESLHLKWDNNLPAFKSASGGILQIRDGNNSKTVEITREDITRGGIVYRNSTQVVQFRLELPQKERGSVSESIEVRVAGMPPARR